MANLDKRAKRYPTDLTDEGWVRMVPFMPQASSRGCKPATDLREVLSALRCIARAGCGWRIIPEDFPRWQTV